MKPRCILFDLDGTLINTWDLYMEVYWRTLRFFQGDHITKDAVLSMKPTSELHFIKKHIGADRLEDAHEVMMNMYEELHDDLFGGVYVGVHEILDAVRRNNTVTGIVTGKSTRAWEITSSKIDIGAFDVVVVDDDVSAPKPDPEGIHTALSKAGASPDESVYIGDTITDFKAARDAGVKSITVLWAKTPREKENFISLARDNGAENFVNHPEELLHILV